MRILLIRLSSLGDVVMTVPAVNALIAAHPDWLVDFVTDSSYVPVVKGIQGVNEIYSIDRKNLKKLKFKHFNKLFSTLKKLLINKYDVVVDFQSYTETGMLSAFTKAPLIVGRGKGVTWYYNLHLGRVPNDRAIWEMHFETLQEAGLLASEYRERAAEFFRLIPSEDDVLKTANWVESEQISQSAFKLGLFVSASRPEKCWSYINYLDFIEQVSKEVSPLEVIFFGGLNDDEIRKNVFDNWAKRIENSSKLDKIVRIHWISSPSLLEIVEISRQLNFFISNDTGPYHLAVMSGVQTLGLFQKPLLNFFPPEPHRVLVAPEADMSKLKTETVINEFLSFPS